MVSIKNCPNPEAMEFIQFCMSRFNFTYPIELEFKKKFRYNGCWYPYKKKVVVNLNQYIPSLLFHTIAHEIRHVEQDMYPLITSADLLPRERLLKNAKERDANVTARKWIAEYISFKSGGRCSPDNYEFNLSGVN